MNDKFKKEVDYVIKGMHKSVRKNTKGRISPCYAYGICNVVAEFYGTTFYKLMGNSTMRKFVLPRQVMMFMLRKYGKLSLPEIGGFVGNKSYSTVHYGVRAIANLVVTDKEFLQDYILIKERIERYLKKQNIPC